MITTRRTSTTGAVAFLAAAALVAPAGLATPSETPSFAAPAASEAAASANVDDLVLESLEFGPVDVVVRTTPGATDRVRAELEGAGARILADLSFIDAFAAQIERAHFDLLAARTDVAAITADREAEFQASGGTSGGKGDSWFEDTVNADDLRAAGFDGSGVGIAIFDTGITAHPTLGNRLEAGVDATGEASGFDHFGHGTFLAGVAAGSGATSPNNEWDGIAPGATVIPVKVGGATGATLISLMAGMQWIHANHEARGIDVVNMSFGVRSSQPTAVDPLNYGVQRLWASGLVVVVSAGNWGLEGPGSITKPGDDPFVITVGATDSMGTKPTDDDVVPPFSAKGPTASGGIAKPDLVAPGRSLTGPVADGSEVDGLTAQHIGDGWVRATGTSMSTAVVSGAVALLLDVHPDWTPDQVKGALLDSAAPGPVGDPNVDGHGLLDIAAAAAVANPSNPNAGLLSGVWSTTTITDPITGLTVTVVNSDWAGDQWQGDQWQGDQWQGDQWQGDQWQGDQWQGDQWQGDQWHGDQWQGDQWY